MNQAQSYDAAAVNLATSIRAWWEENKNATTGSRGERNFFHETPDFVRRAKAILGDWECSLTAAQLADWDGTHAAASSLLAIALNSGFSEQAIDTAAEELLRDEVCDIDESQTQFRMFATELKTFRPAAHSERVAHVDVRILAAKYGLSIAP